MRENKHAMPSLPYIPWGLIWDLNTRRRDSNTYTLRKGKKEEKQ